MPAVEVVAPAGAVTRAPGGEVSSRGGYPQGPQRAACAACLQLQLGCSFPKVLTPQSSSHFDLLYMAACLPTGRDAGRPRRHGHPHHRPRIRGHAGWRPQAAAGKSAIGLGITWECSVHCGSQVHARCPAAAAVGTWVTTTHACRHQCTATFHDQFAHLPVLAPSAAGHGACC